MDRLTGTILRIYNQMVRLYPRAYFQEYSEELLAVFNLALIENQPRGR